MAKKKKEETPEGFNRIEREVTQADASDSRHTLDEDKGKETPFKKFGPVSTDQQVIPDDPVERIDPQLKKTNVKELEK